MSDNQSNNTETSEDAPVEDHEYQDSEDADRESPTITQEFASTFSQRFTCDLDFDPFKPGAHLSVPLSASHSGHKWLLTLKNLTTSYFEVKFGTFEEIVGQFATDAQIFVSVARIDNDRENPIPITSKLWSVDALPWKSNSSFVFNVQAISVRISRDDDKPLTSHEYPQLYRIVVEYKGVTSHPSFPSGREATIARRMSAFLSSPGAKDVCLSFSQGHKIWVESKQLSALSAYFEKCLSAGFSEGEARVPDGTSDQTNGEGEPSMKKRKTAEDFDDSDDESDLTLKTHGRLSDSQTPSYPFQTIPISQAAFVTYQATLTWQQTGFIRFAPLTSSFLGTTSSEPTHPALVRKQQQKETRRIAESDPSLPHPVSSKSLYRLAHFLEIPELKELALLAFSQRLTPQGAIYEFLSHEASVYPEIRKIVLEYIVKHSQKVIKSASYTNMFDLVISGDMKYASFFPSLFEALSLSFAADSEETSPVEEKMSTLKKVVSGKLFP